MSETNNEAATPSQEKGPRGQFGMFLIGLIVLWSLVWLGVSKGMEIKFKTLWSEASGKPVSPYFAFIGFPKSASVSVYDAEGGSPVGELGRAVKLSTEGEATEWITLAGVPATYVRRSDLTLAPPLDSEQWLKGYRREMEARKGLEFVDADVTVEEIIKASTTVTFTQHWDDSRERSTYTIADGRGVPLEYSRATAAAAMSDTSCLLVPVWIICGMTATRFLWRRLKESRAMPAP